MHFQLGHLGRTSRRKRDFAIDTVCREPRDQAGFDTTRLIDHRPKVDKSTTDGGSNSTQSLNFFIECNRVGMPNGGYVG